MGLHFRLAMPCKQRTSWRSVGVDKLVTGPSFIHSDKWPEFIAHALRFLTGSITTARAYIEISASCQNGFVDSFNTRLRDELLYTVLFYKATESQALADCRL
jgi:hypothetical protein